MGGRGSDGWLLHVTVVAGVLGPNLVVTAEDLVVQFQDDRVSLLLPQAMILVVYVPAPLSPQHHGCILQGAASEWMWV